MLGEALGEEMMERAVNGSGTVLEEPGQMLSGLEAFEVLMELRASKVSSSEKWMSLSDELRNGS